MDGILKSKTILESNYDKENANLCYSNLTLEKNMGGFWQSQIFLSQLPKVISDSHLNGDLHIHDLDFAWTRPNCVQLPMEMVFRQGLDVIQVRSKQTKHLEVAISHLTNTVAYVQGMMSGGIGLPLINVLLAPYADSMSYDQLFKKIQGMIFQLNQINPARGTQAAFSSINYEYGVPDFLKDVEVGYGRNPHNTYADYEDEAKNIFKATCDVFRKGDGEGKPFPFPNFISVYRKETEDMELMGEIVDTNLKTGNGYWLNMAKYGNKLATAMGCRTYLDDSFTGNYKFDSVATGNLEYVTINMPRLMIKYADNYEEGLYELSRKVAHILLLRRQRVKELYDSGAYSFFDNYHDEVDGKTRKMYNLEYTTMGLGFVGLAESMTLLGEDYDSPMREKILKSLNNIKDEFNEKTYAELGKEIGIEYTGEEERSRWSVLASPAESCATRLKKSDLSHYGSILQDYKINEKMYYTNGTMLPEDVKSTLIDKINYEAPCHANTAGGNITHIWNTGVDSSVNAELVKNILNNTSVRYMTFSPVIVYCPKCGKFENGSKTQTSCNTCGCTDIKMYTKVSGYLQEVKRFHDGKKQEFKNRQIYR